jgi:hypothetical protein
MPLKPIDKETGKPKAFADYSEAEIRHFVEQLTDEQMRNHEGKRNVDHAAIATAAKLAKDLGHKDLQDSVQSLQDHIRGAGNVAR